MSLFNYHAKVSCGVKLELLENSSCEEDEVFTFGRIRTSSPESKQSTTTTNVTSTTRLRSSAKCYIPLLI